MLPENSPTSSGSSAARRTCACMAGVTSAMRSIRMTARRPTAPPLPWWRHTASKRSWTSPNRYRHWRTSCGRLECHRRRSSAGASCAARCAVVGGAWRRALLMVSGAILRSWRCSLRRIYTPNDTTSVEISLISLAQFHKSLSNTKSNDLMSDLSRVQASKPHNNIGMNLLHMYWITTSSEATGATLPKILLAARWNHVWHHLKST